MAKRRHDDVTGTELGRLARGSGDHEVRRREATTPRGQVVRTPATTRADAGITRHDPRPDRVHIHTYIHHEPCQ
jgi:hypothetical protein